jgi:hypothetical protein
MPSSPRLLPLCAAALLFSAASVEAQSPTLLRLSNAAAQERLTVDSAGAVLMRGAVDVGAVQNRGAGPMLMWYPRKAAFRAGNVNGTQWNDAGVGYYSTALGANTTASGSASTAMGAGATASGQYSTALGSSAASGDYSTAMGAATTASGGASTSTGYGTTASGNYSTAMGAGTTASGQYSAALGYSTTASGQYSTAIGHSSTASGSNSTAIGYYASTNGHAGSFVYGDNSTQILLTATAANQFSVRAAGGVRFFTNSTMDLGAQLSPGAGSWSTLSDRNAKAEFLAVDGEDLLGRIRQVPVSTWVYRAQPDRSVRHIGPMAQDWARAFGFSTDSLTINTGDFDGVNLAAAQALATRTDALRAADAHHLERIRSLEEEIATLHARNSLLEERLERLERAAGTAP